MTVQRPPVQSVYGHELKPGAVVLLGDEPVIVVRVVTDNGEQTGIEFVAVTIRSFNSDIERTLIHGRYERFLRLDAA